MAEQQKAGAPPDAAAAVGTPIRRQSMHASLGEPSLGAIGFLNEVIDRFPDAISFAPGAPAPSFLEPIDVASHLETYVSHLQRTEGLTAAQVRRRLFQYGPSRGIINRLIVEALAQDQGIKASPRDVVVTVGFQEGMLLALRALFAQPAADVLAVVQPCFAGAVGAARILGIDVVAVDEGEAGIDLTALRDRCRRLRTQGRRVRGLYVAPDHANPSGTLMPRAQRDALLALADEEQFFIFEDATYGFTAGPEDALPSLKALDHCGKVVHIGTFAKIAMPAARVGFVVANQPVEGGGVLADALATLKTMTTVNTSPICQAVIGGMLLEQGGSLRALGATKGRHYRRLLQVLLAALTRHVTTAPGSLPVWNHPRGGFFVRMRIAGTADTDLLQYCAQRYGVLWTPMSMFYLDEGGRDELRLSCSYLEEPQIEEGVARLAAFLRDPAVHTPLLGHARNAASLGELGLPC